jgi:hypothetical protein
MKPSLSNRFRNLTGRAAARTSARPRPKARLQVESLEERAVPSATSALLGSSANPVTEGQSVTFTATVLGGDFPAGANGGVVTFYDGANALGMAPVTPAAGGLLIGTAQFTASGLGVGSHSLTAKYSGEFRVDGGIIPVIHSDDPSTSNAVTEVVNPLIIPVPAPKPTVTTLTGPAGAVTLGQPVTLTATVTGGAFAAGSYGGTVTFSDGNTFLATVPVTKDPGGALRGTATFTTSGLGTGNHSFTAKYSGERSSLLGPGDAPSTSNAVTELVNPPPPMVVDVSSQVRVTRVKGKHRPLMQQLTLKNVGGTAINGPIYVVLDGLGPRVVLRNAAGTAQKHDSTGDPFVLVNVGQLAPGQSTTLTLLFRNPRHKAINFTTDVLAGLGQV